MDNKESFENAIKNVELKNAVQKMKAVNFAEEFARRGVNIGSDFSEEK